MSPGDLVVCVNNGIIPDAWNMDLSRLTVGNIYTIDDVCDRGPACLGVRLVEVPIKWWWHPARFRPCRKTNIDALIACAKERETESV